MKVAVKVRISKKKNESITGSLRFDFDGICAISEVCLTYQGQSLSGSAYTPEFDNLKGVEKAFTNDMILNSGLVIFSETPEENTTMVAMKDGAVFMYKSTYISPLMFSVEIEDIIKQAFKRFKKEWDFHKQPIAIKSKFEFEV